MMPQDENADHKDAKIETTEKQGAEDQKSDDRPLPSFNPDSASEKFKAMFNCGLHNKITFILAAVTFAVMFFLPVAAVGLGGQVYMLGGGLGLFIAIIFIIFMCFLYGGVDAVFTRIAGAIALATIFLGLGGVFSDIQKLGDLSRMITGNSSSLNSGLKLGFFLTLGLSGRLAYRLFRVKTDKNPRTF